MNSSIAIHNTCPRIGIKQMKTQRSLTEYLMLLILLTAALVTGCATTTKIGAFTEVTRMEAELERGLSTKTDVRRVLGAPEGFGSSLLPTKQSPREVWFYQGQEVTGTPIWGRGVKIDFREQILLVFFEGEVFDGFMWFSNAGAGEASAK